ncbi:GNAT family N-acetyltransferase [uncultured Tenacibaculum sp.]|uniref:GNAT family N-acetyltransferase n=1 Tax=uncultured Tenacibaculum sp. TaxID=174713 RepID=UPI002629B269|nr:GNAT family N-acetyltransferase [uncultured Tenacibaculum sp.]
MESKTIVHQFEFWCLLGKVGTYIRLFDGYTVLQPQKGNWPFKIFNLQNVDIEKLKKDIIQHKLPRAIAIESNHELNTKLEEHGFIKSSVVEAMSLNISSHMSFKPSANITKVTDEIGLHHFTTIASKAFGYTIDKSSLSNVLQNNSVQLFIGKHKDQYASCGILFLDSKGNSGLHMIGVNHKYRGLGFGKEMTEHLLYNACINNSKTVHLVASKYGAPIYKKYGFTNNGYLNSYKGLF